MNRNCGENGCPYCHEGWGCPHEFILTEDGYIVGDFKPEIYDFLVEHIEAKFDERSRYESASYRPRCDATGRLFSERLSVLQRMRSQLIDHPKWNQTCVYANLVSNYCVKF